MALELYHHNVIGRANPQALFCMALQLAPTRPQLLMSQLVGAWAVGEISVCALKLLLAGESWWWLHILYEDGDEEDISLVRNISMGGWMHGWMHG